VSNGATMLHADLDAFYASVEQLLDPDLHGRPIAVGGNNQGGVVLAASYEAKARGVQGGMDGRQARALCPDLIFVPGHFSEYQRLADKVMDVLGDITPAVERVSIDEAFLDVSGATHLFGSPATIGAALRARVRHEIGLPISVGAATTKHLAKVASQVAKPDGLVVVEPGSETEFLTPLPVRLIWGIGPATERRLADRGIHTVGDLAATSTYSLTQLLGSANATKLSALAHDQDPRVVSRGARVRSVGAQSAMSRRTPTAGLVRNVISLIGSALGSGPSGSAAMLWLSGSDSPRCARSPALTRWRRPRRRPSPSPRSPNSWFGKRLIRSAPRRSRCWGYLCPSSDQRRASNSSCRFRRRTPIVLAHQLALHVGPSTAPSTRLGLDLGLAPWVTCPRSCALRRVSRMLSGSSRSGTCSAASLPEVGC
jgi:nucleotidyltransferase/DNA polymerase involved in DNA repair